MKLFLKSYSKIKLFKNFISKHTKIFFFNFVEINLKKYDYSQKIIR